MLKSLCEAMGNRILYFCAASGKLTLLLLATLRRLKDANAKEVVRQMALLGADSLPIVMMTILCTGMVFSVQTAKEFVRLGASSSVGGIVAIAMARELVPVLTGVVVAGRIGAVPRFIALVLMMPVLVVFANFIGNIGGWVVAHYYAGIGSFTYENSIRTLAEFYDVFGGMVKSCVFGAIIAIVGCYKGLNAPNGAEGVGLATTASVVLSIILVFITNYFLSIVLYV